MILKSLGVPFYPHPSFFAGGFADQSDPTAPVSADGVQWVASADHPVQVPLIKVPTEEDEEEDEWDEAALGPKPKVMKTLLTRREAIDEVSAFVFQNYLERGR